MVEGSKWWKMMIAAGVGEEYHISPFFPHLPPLLFHMSVTP